MMKLAITKTSIFTQFQRIQLMSSKSGVRYRMSVKCRCYQIVSMILAKRWDYGSKMPALMPAVFGDRKSTRLNSSHVSISYAVFCLKKKNQVVFRRSVKTVYSETAGERVCE